MVNKVSNIVLRLELTGDLFTSIRFCQHNKYYQHKETKTKPSKKHFFRDDVLRFKYKTRLNQFSFYKKVKNILKVIELRNQMIVLLALLDEYCLSTSPMKNGWILTLKGFCGYSFTQWGEYFVPLTTIVDRAPLISMRCHGLLICSLSLLIFLFCCQMSKGTSKLVAACWLISIKYLRKIG